MLDRRAIVTIDGPSGAGKSTISRMLAQRLGFTYLDTGAMYRAVGLLLVREGVALEDTAALTARLAGMELSLQANGDRDVRVLLNQEDVSLAIRSPEMALAASRVSAHPLVREKLTRIQQEIGAGGGIVAEGRDMGTVVFPQADFKFFLDATPEERARRRREQLALQGQEIALEEILDQIKKRDYADSKRALAPLAAAADAIIVDSSSLSLEGVIAFMLTAMADSAGH
jgi:CMP/dCMP kinase